MKGKHRGIIRIGTSNIVVPGTKKDFPEEFRAGSRLHYYGSLFNTLEVNSSFYKIPLPSTFEKWAGEVPDDFKFTVKLWREITHAKKLLFSENSIDHFMQAADRLRSKSGCLLIQFPASITIDYLLQTERIFKRLNHLNTHGQWNVAVEVRHRSWYQEGAYEVFDRHQVSLVLHDMPASKTPGVLPFAGPVYLRFHGVKGDYKGGYENEVLEECSDRIKNWSEMGRDVYVYFNNTLGDAYKNAQSLKRLTL